MIRSNGSGLDTLVGFHRSPGLSRGCDVASWGHQCPKLEGGDHLPRPYFLSFSDPVSLATLSGPKGRRGHWPAGVFRLCSSLWVPPSEDRRVPALLVSDDGLTPFQFLTRFSVLFIHHQRRFLVKDVLQACWDVKMRPVWKNGRSVMAQMTAGTEQMSWIVVNDTNKRHNKVQIYV